MINTAFLAVATVTFGAALIKAASVLQPRRQPGQGLILVLLLTLAVSCFALSDKVQYQEDRVYHDLGRLLSNVTTMIAAFAILALLITVSLSLPDAKPRIRRHLLALAGCVAGMITTFAAASPLPESLGDFGGLYATRPELLGYIALYMAFLGTALTELLILAWRYARLARRYRWLRAGLLFMWTGSVLGLVYIGEKAVYVFTQATRLPPPFASDQGCRSLLTPPQCAFSITLPITAVFLAAIGATLPVWGAALAAPFRYYQAWRTFQALQPLWETVHGAFPEVVLHETGDRSRWGLTFRLYRRVIEIDDGRLLLRPHMSEAVTADATAAAADHGLQGDEMRAAVEAAEIAVALCLYQSGSPAFAAASPEQAAPDSDDVLREAAWLAKVARAYTTSPVVRGLVTRLSDETVYPEPPSPAR